MGAVFLPVPRTAAAEGAKLTTELADLRELRTRLVLDSEPAPRLGPVRLLWIDVRGGDRAAERAFGLCTDRFLIGPVLPAGLIRELSRPLGYGPGSDVFSEPSGLRLDTGFSPNRRGLSVGGSSPGCTVYLVDAGSALCSGFLLTPAPRREASGEVLFGASGAEVPAPEERWYVEEPDHPGGLLCHGAARVLWRREWLRGSAAGALCCGERIRPGGFLRFSLHGGHRWWEADLLAAAATDAYVSPEGLLGDWSRALGTRLRVGGGEGFSVSAEYRLQAAPARGWPEGYRAARETASAELGARRAFGRFGAARAALSCALCRRFETDGTTDRDAGVRLELEGTGRAAGCGLWVGLEADGGQRTTTGGLRWDVEPERGKKARLEVEMSPEHEVQITVAVRFDTKRGGFRSRLTLSPSGMKSLLAWEVEG
jgi:hypothetical protein